jgi:hypothetical protein
LQKINQGVHQLLQGQAVQDPAQGRLNRVYNIFIKLNYRNQPGQLLQGQAVNALAQRCLYRVYNIFLKLIKFQKINQGVNQRLKGQAVQAPAQPRLYRVYKILKNQPGGPAAAPGPGCTGSSTAPPVQGF